MPVSPLDSFARLPFLEKMRSFPATQLRKFDALLADIGGYMYDMAEAIQELPDTIKDLKPAAG